MRLSELKPRWIKPHAFTVDDILIGMTFECPACRVHRMYVPFSNPIDPRNILPGTTWRGQEGWTRTGDTFETISLGRSVTVECEKGNVLNGANKNCWHGNISNGDVTTQ